MLTAVLDAAAAGDEAIAAAGHDDLPPAPAMSVTTGFNPVFSLGSGGGGARLT
jgi:hypothetical protein